MKRRLFWLTLLALPFLVLHAQPGSPDLSFGVKGTLTNPARKNYTKALVSTPDKKILIGSSGFYQGYNTFLIDRLLPDGNPDSSFGTNGSTYILFSEWNDALYSDSYIITMTSLPDGKIIAAGHADAYSGTIALARFLPNGAPDTTFGSRGTSLTGFHSSESISAIAVQPDGKILLGGHCTPPSATNIHLFTARYLPDGSIDNSYGDSGVLISASAGSTNALAVQPDGKILAAGYGIGKNKITFHTERYNSNGTFDVSFGKNGIVNNRLGDGTNNFINDIALQNDGKMVMAGYSDGTGIQSFTIGRYKKDGMPDANFGGTGFITTPFKARTGTACKVMIAGENSNRILVAGSTYSTLFGGDFVLIAYRKNGSLDSSFGENGIKTTDFGGTDFANTSTLQPDGKIVLLGSNNGRYPYAVQALARYNGYPAATTLYVTATKWANNHIISWDGLPASERIALYSIEQSSNGRDGFAQIGHKNGKDGLQRYAYTNNQLLPGTNWYRIKATGEDGSVKYSEVASVNNATSVLDIFPNPAKDYITLYGLKTNILFNISITDGRGNVLIKGVSNGSNQYRAIIGSWRPGNYYVHVTVDGKTELIPFIKQ